MIRDKAVKEWLAVASQSKSKKDEHMLKEL